jgi:phosphoribosylformylglycinamidine cyclo-ligase
MTSSSPFSDQLASDQLSSEPYRQAGVDLDRADAVVVIAKQHAQTTPKSTALGGIGGFSGAFEIPPGYQQPVMLAACDGVGTKLKLAELTGIHHTIGQDLVAMSVNDILVSGGRPLVFLDYVATGKIDTHLFDAILQGVAEGCRQSDCNLLGGETAEMPGVYIDKTYDLAGFALGVVEKSQVLPRQASIQPGDHIIGLQASGPHSNGYSLIRRIVEMAFGPDSAQQQQGLQSTLMPDGTPLAQALMAPTRIYVQPILQLLRELPQALKAMVHVTGGGFYDNIPRVLPEGMGAQLQGWDLPPVFDWLQTHGQLSNEAVWHTFNAGYGFLLICSPTDSDHVMQLLPAEWQPVCLGNITTTPGVHITSSTKA